MQKRAAPFSFSRKQVIAIPSFYKSRPTKHQTSAEKVTVGKKNDREREEQTSVQVDESRAQPRRDEQGEHLQNQVNSDDVGDKELRQTVTQLNSLLTGNSNGNYTSPDSRPDAPTGDSHAKQKLKGNIPSAKNSELNPDLNSSGISSNARDNQNTPTVSLQANKPRWTRVVRVNNKPSEEVSLDKLSKKKRIAALSEDHSELPNKRYQVSRNEEDTGLSTLEGTLLTPARASPPCKATGFISSSTPFFFPDVYSLAPPSPSPIPDTVM
nr:hypothetical protein CFP56_68093 [Quercus suber]